MSEELDRALQQEAAAEASATKLEIERRKRKFEEYQASSAYMDRLRQRLQVNDACFRNPDGRKLIYQAVSKQDTPEQITDSICLFIELFGFTFDPRPQAYPNHLPFIPFDYQKDAIKWLVNCIENAEDGLIEKSRDMGITYIMMYVCFWYWLFREGTNILVGSYKEDLVDNKTVDSLFGIIDYAVSSMPKWILPRNFKKDKNRTHLKLTNPMNWNQITGDTMNSEFGRGARKTLIIFDELGSWEYARDAWESASQSTTCRIANSTPKGKNFYSHLANETNIKKLRLHWTLHPLKDVEWYEFEKSRNSEETVAQELDISYSKSQTGRVYPEWNEVNVIFDKEYDYNPEWPLYIFWDFGNTDDTALIWAQKNPINGKLRILDSYSNHGKTIQFYVPFVTGIIEENGYAYSRKDVMTITEHRRYRRATHFGDPAGRFKNSVSDQTIFSVLREHNIMVNFRDTWKEFNRRKGALRNLIVKGVEVYNNERNKEILDICMSNASYPKVRNAGMEEINSVKPKHDYTSHVRSAMEYGALGLLEVRNAYSSVYDKIKPGNNRTGIVRY